MPSGRHDASDNLLTRAILGTVTFTIFVPGTVVVLVPYLLSRWHINVPFLGSPIVPLLGAALILVALPFFVCFLSRFVF